MKPRNREQQSAVVVVKETRDVYSDVSVGEKGSDVDVDDLLSSVLAVPCSVIQSWKVLPNVGWIDASRFK